jgi:hypothetical protein
MRSHSGRLTASVAALAVVALTLTSPVSASADEGPLQDTVGSVTDEVTGTVDDTVSGLADATKAPKPAAKGTSTKGDAPATSSDDDSPGHETEDPAAPDHGSATIIEGGAAGQDVATVGDSTATVEDDDSTRSDATLLALGGEEVLGAHADSGKEQEAHFGDPLAPLCEGSEGQVCLRVLYADAWATDKDGTSRSRSQSGVADVCLGGDDADPSAACSGPVATGVAGSEGKAQRDQRSGRTTASSGSDVADVCVQKDPVTGGCALGADAVHSEGGSDSGGSRASADRDSYLLALDAGGEEQGRVGDPQAFALPPECPEGTSVLCVFMNQGESYVAKQMAGHAQEALHLSVLPGNLDLVVELSRSESLVHNDGGEQPAGDSGDSGPARGVGSGGPGQPGSVAGVEGLLPNTGGVWSGLLALGLLAIGSGALLAARAQRRVAASA